MIIKANLVPAGHFAPRVVSFTIEDIRGADRPATRRSPRAVGYNPFQPSVRKFNLELGDQARMIAVDVPRLFEHSLRQTDAARIPSIAQQRTNHVVTCL